MFFIDYLPLKPLASLTRVTKRGLTSNWHFVQAPDGFYAFGGCHKPLVKRFETVQELRSLYERYVREYGYQQVADTSQLELAIS